MTPPRYANTLHALGHDLAGREHGLSVHWVIGEVTEARRLHAIMAASQPAIVFHAAAHTHVPLMALHPCAAVQHHVGGTRTVAEAAARFRAERFMLISTDKAVHPSSVMGATRRVAELLVQRLAQSSQTRCVVVRFGHVLGSNGSVVPRFLEHIRAGGPVTVTPPEVQRSCMLIPEAVPLVLQAVALGHSGAV